MFGVVVSATGDGFGIVSIGTVSSVPMGSNAVIGISMKRSNIFFVFNNAGFRL